MKIRRLPDIDLARIAPLARDQQRKHLEQFRYGRPPFSYAPLRACFHDIFNVQPALFGPVAPTDWVVVEETLRKKCKSEDEFIANLRVAKGLHQFTNAKQIFGRAREFFPLGMGAGQRVVYWLSMILAIDEQPLVPFIDPRRSKGLTEAGRRFAFSMMHERIRAADPDYANVRFAIFQFGDIEGDIRRPMFHTDEGIELFSIEEMETMVATTYELWREVCEERETETRRKASGTRGSLI